MISSTEPVCLEFLSLQVWNSNVLTTVMVTESKVNLIIRKIEILLEVSKLPLGFTYTKIIRFKLWQYFRSHTSHDANPVHSFHMWYKLPHCLTACNHQCTISFSLPQLPCEYNSHNSPLTSWTNCSNLSTVVAALMITSSTVSSIVVTFWDDFGSANLLNQSAVLFNWFVKLLSINLLFGWCVKINKFVVISSGCCIQNILLVP